MVTIVCHCYITVDVIAGGERERKVTLAAEGATNLVLQSLSPGTTYHISVQAENKLGPGPDSHSLTVTTLDEGE